MAKMECEMTHQEGADRLEERTLLDAPPPVQPYAPGSWGPRTAETLPAGQGRWHGPWSVS